MHRPTDVPSTVAAAPSPASGSGAEGADDRGVDEHEQRLGDERPERGTARRRISRSDRPGEARRSAAVSPVMRPSSRARPRRGPGAGTFASQALRVAVRTPRRSPVGHRAEVSSLPRLGRAIAAGQRRLRIKIHWVIPTACPQACHRDSRDVRPHVVPRVVHRARCRSATPRTPSRSREAVSDPRRTHQAEAAGAPRARAAAPPAGIRGGATVRQGRAGEEPPS